MTITDNANNIRTVMMGAILTGIALVIANSWGDAIKKTVNLVVNNVRCGKYLVLKNDKTDANYNKCKEQESIYSLYINAIITSILLSIIVLVLFGKHGVSTIHS